MVGPDSSDSLATMRHRPTLVVLLACVAVLAACSSGSSSPDPTGGSASAAQVLAATKATVDKATSLHLTLAGKDLPGSFNGVVSADGVGTHAPAFKGTFQVQVGTTQAAADVVTVDGTTYVKLPFTSSYAPVKPETLGAPDPATLFTPATGITSLLTATTDAAKGAQTRKGSEVLTTYTGHLPGAAVAALLVIGDRSAVFDVSYGITDSGQLRTVALKGPFYSGATSTYELTLDKYGDPVAIDKP